MKRVILFATMALTLCSFAFAQDEAAKRKAAEQAAQTWLAVVDQGNYGQSWDSAATFFKSHVSRENWEPMVKQVRGQIGKAGKREVASSTYQTELPNVPKGEYVVIQYKTKFGAGTMAETVVPMLDADGKWRVSGYFVRPAN
jgi:opacity protein-like surface antigen